MAYWRIGYKATLIVLLLLLGAVLVLAIGLASQLRIVNKHKRIVLTHYWYKVFLFCCGIQCQYYGSLPDKAALVVSNHRSWLDIVVLGALLPTYFLSKAEVKKWPVIGWLSSRVGTLFIQRGSSEQEKIKQQMQCYLLQNQNILFFPEGGTGDGNHLRLFQPRLFACAIECQLPVLPVAISYGDENGHHALPIETASQSFFKNVLLTLSAKRVLVDLHTLSVISTEDLSRKEVAHAAQTSIAGQLQLPVGRSTLKRQRTIELEEV